MSRGSPLCAAAVPFLQLAKRHWPVGAAYAALALFAALELGSVGQWLLCAVTQLLGVLVTLGILLDALDVETFAASERARFAAGMTFWMRVELVVLFVQCVWAWILDPTAGWIALVATGAFLFDLFEHVFAMHTACHPRVVDPTTLFKTHRFFRALASAKLAYHAVMFGLILGVVGPHVILRSASRHIDEFISDNRDAIFE